MLQGSVNEHGEPLVRIVLLSSRHYRHRHQAVIDTGFNGLLSLPEQLARCYHWRWLGYESYEIATGDVVQEKVFLGQIYWHGHAREVYAVTSHAKDILIGTRLLQQHRLTIDFRKRMVQIT